MKENDGMTPSMIDQSLAKIKPSPVVVIIDDDPLTHELLGRSLHDEGYQTHSFKQAEEFLENHKGLKPDAIVTEAVLPGMSGLSVLDEIRPKSFEEMIPVLVLSRKDDSRAKLLAFRRGAFDYVIKPFDAGEVTARVRALVRSKVLQDVLVASSVSDPLTQLYNRRFLLIWLEREIERVKRYALDLSCLLVDLDDFKHLNEKQGTGFGDFLLREFGKLILQNTRKSDIVGRLAGDEFLVFLPGTSKEHAMTVAKRLRESAALRKFEVKGKKAKPSFCIGIIGAHAQEAAEADIFIQRAEEALMKSKSVGTDKTAVMSLD